MPAALLFFLVGKFFFLEDENIFLSVANLSPVTSCFLSSNWYLQEKAGGSDLQADETADRFQRSSGPRSTRQCSEGLGQALPHESGKISSPVMLNGH